MEYAQQIAQNFQRSCSDNQAAILTERTVRAERSPALTPDPQVSRMPAARRGPRIKTTIRTGISGDAHMLAVKVVATGRVLTSAPNPTANFTGPRGRSPSPDARVSGTTVTISSTGSPTPSTVDSTVGATREQRPATAELDCSEKLGTASPSDQSPIFPQSPSAYTNSNGPDYQLLGISVQSPQAAIQISASEALNQVAANEQQVVAANTSTSPAALMAAFEAEHATTRAAAAAAGESGGAEAVEEWAHDEEAMQAASALAVLADSNWAGRFF